MNRYVKVLGVLGAIVLAGLGVMCNLLLNARHEERRTAASRSELRERLTHPQPQHPQPQPDPEALRRMNADGEAAQSISEAWDIYWDGHLQQALEVLTAERQKNRSSVYRAEYFDNLIAALPSYDSELQRLIKQRDSTSGHERDDVIFKIYKLSKEFYEQNGKQTETSWAYGPEFKEAQGSLIGTNEEVTFENLIASWSASELESCYMGDPDKPIAELSGFLNTFPKSLHRKVIEEVLEAYRSGRVLCNPRK